MVEPFLTTTFIDHVGLEAEHNTRCYARIVLSGVEEIGLQVVGLDAPSHTADQAEIDTSSEIKGKGRVLLSHVGDKRIGGNGLMSQPEKSLSKGRQSADGNRSAGAEQVGVQVGVGVQLPGTQETGESHRYRSISGTNIAGGPEPVKEPD